MTATGPRPRGWTRVVARAARDLPVVAEADARRARFAAMFARLKRAEEAERG